MYACIQTDNSGEREVVKEIGEVFPNIGSAVHTQAFVVKAIDLCNLTALVVTPRQCDAIGVSHLKSHLYKYIIYINTYTYTHTHIHAQ